MSYNFDEVIDRSGTDSLKWEALEPRWGRTDLLPLWIADMEFKTPPFVKKAIEKRIENEIFGYTSIPESWYEAIINWQKKRNNWNITKESILFSPGVVPGLALAIQAFTEKGDKVMIQQPVYPPFILAVQNNQRTLVNSPLRLVNGNYQIDFEQFEKNVEGCKLFILCNPHNPGGRVWTSEEMERIADICYRNNVFVISDEIHSDLTLSPYKHQVFATINEKARENCLVFNSPSKPFNMAGFSSAYAIIENETMREKFQKNTYIKCMLGDGNLFSFNTLVSVYTAQGEQWLDELLKYVQDNINWVADFVQKNLPKVKIIRPQASYLIFLDCRQMQLTQKELVNFFVDKANLALNDGEMFGKEGGGFMRINVACPRSILQKAFNQLLRAFESE